MDFKRTRLWTTHRMQYRTWAIDWRRPNELGHYLESRASDCTNEAITPTAYALKGNLSLSLGRRTLTLEHMEPLRVAMELAKAAHDIKLNIFKDKTFTTQENTFEDVTGMRLELKHDTGIVNLTLADDRSSPWEILNETGGEFGMSAYHLGELALEQLGALRYKAALAKNPTYPQTPKDFATLPKSPEENALGAILKQLAHVHHFTPEIIEDSQHSLKYWG